MAQVSENFWGIVLILDHDETRKVLGVGNDVANIMAEVGKQLSKSDFAMIGNVLQLIAFGISINLKIIEAVDKGSGVYLTSPWVAMGVIVPTTRAEGIGLGADWAMKRSGQFHTEDAPDLISYEVIEGAASPDIVEFSLESVDSHMWGKTLVMRDGSGNQWDIAIDPSQGSSFAKDSLWAGQVRNGQALSLWKAKQFGIMTWVLDIKYLDPIPPGSRVAFKWLKD